MKTPSAVKLQQVCSLFEELNPQTPVRQVHTFVVIAMLNEERRGVTYKEIERLMGIPQSSTSRTIEALGTNSARGVAEGPDLVLTAPDPDDSRAKIAFLTGRGRRLWERMKAIVEGD